MSVKTRTWSDLERGHLASDVSPLDVFFPHVVVIPEGSWAECRALDAKIFAPPFSSSTSLASWGSDSDSEVCFPPLRRGFVGLESDIYTGQVSQFSELGCKKKSGFSQRSHC